MVIVMKDKKISYYHKCKYLLGKDAKRVVWCCAFGIISMLFSLANSIFAAYYGINKALMSGSFDKIVLATVVIGTLGMLSTLTFHVTYRLCLRIVKSVAIELRQRVFRKTIYLDTEYYNTHASGAMLNTIIYDVATFADGMTWSFQWICKLIVKILLSFTIVTFINFRLSLILWVIAPIVVVLSIFIFRKVGKQYDKRRTIVRKRLGFINEGIMGVKTVKSLNLEDDEDRTFKKFNREYGWANFKISIMNDSFWRMFDVFVYAGLALLFLNSYKLSISYGELFLYYQLFKDALYSVGHLAGEFDYFTEVAVSAGKIYNMLTYDPLIKDKEVTINKKDDLIGDIKFNNVTFKYPKGETVLKDFNFEIKPKQRVAIVGKTGSGKSTIASLLYRFYEPTGGNLTIDGIDYTDMKIQYIHEQIGFILQEPMLFDDTIYENLKYAKSDATEEEIYNAAKMVGAHEFIANLKDGYQTRIGESGILLSNGQKQLLAFARVILKDPSIVILDEATANIDSQTEYLIQKNIDEVFSGKTCLFIAHRLSTIQNCDKIVYLEKGKILEEGSHDELMELNGKYATLYKNQFIRRQLGELIEEA